jgi:hypothetical protein
MDHMEVQHETSSGTDMSTPERSSSADAMSRASTMSPRPQSGDAIAGLPASNGHEPGLSKHDDHIVDDPSCQRTVEDTLESSSYSHQSYDHNPEDDAGYTLASLGPEYSSMRYLPVSPSSFLRPGSRFHGTQQSERQVYEVQVEIKHVDMRESFLCGYLRIQGLTDDHPTLTTYFEGEIIGTKYNFFTQHDDWGANTKVDLSHWSKFSAFRPFQKSARKGPVSIPDVAQRENIFMRWKEHFLVPDHRVRTISGASFEGFYYICFNQIKGEVSGIYFHSKSEKFQQLELKHVLNRGCFSAMEFR